MQEKCGKFAYSLNSSDSRSKKAPEFLPMTHSLVKVDQVLIISNQQSVINNQQSVINNHQSVISNQ